VIASWQEEKEETKASRGFEGRVGGLGRDCRIAFVEEGFASFGWDAPSEMVANTGAAVDADGAGAGTGVVPRLLVLLVMVAPVVVVIVAGAASPSAFTIATAFIGLMLFD
jgi:hypothetical protein